MNEDLGRSKVLMIELQLLYVNRCGFHIVEFFNSHHPDPNDLEAAEQIDEQFPDAVFRVEKVIF